MLFFDNIYFLILFTLPAALNVIYNAHVRGVPVSKDDKSIEIAECVMFCVAVFFVNIAFIHDDMRLFSRYITLEGAELKLFLETTKFIYVDFIIKYFIVNIISSVSVIVIWYTIGQWLFRFIGNMFNRIRKRPKEYKYSDVWSNVFETKDFIDINNCIIKIERAGILVTAGLIRLYSAPNKQSKEFVLYNTDLIKQLFEDDTNKKLEKRMFKQSLYEYYDIQNDLLIKFYDTKEYNKKYDCEEKEPN